ncbi:DMT family transporter [Paracoccus aerodenitrificans]|uniref:DMT family transporter n=1 Tax=Paracoccus aerodenitrificans TaxID=3017781 RepID=UPI0022F038C9|nr:DMT family transporter [Paracoccus aerodenitrificans]WBU64372.1 DMT family transporter [Paracoccus aerodenitrificans]
MTGANDGIWLRLAAAFLITAMSALIREASDAATLGQIIFWRSAVAMIPICIYMALRGSFPGAFRTARPGAHFLRGTLGALAMGCSFISLTYLPVAHAEALGFLGPVLVLPAAALLLRETISLRLVLAVLVGFAGVIAMLWEGLTMPGANAMIGVAAGLAFAGLTALYRDYVKAMTRTESAATISFYFALFTTCVGLLTLPFGWNSLDPGTTAVLIGAGLLGGLAHIAATEAVARAPVSVLAPFDFTGLIWAVMFDFVLFSTLPGLPGWVGIVAITLAGLLVMLPARRRSDL